MKCFVVMLPNSDELHTQFIIVTNDNRTPITANILNGVCIRDKSVGVDFR